jgi:hypothetical protein
MRIVHQGGQVVLTRELAPNDQGEAKTEVIGHLSVEEAHQLMTTDALRLALAQAKTHSRDTILTQALELEAEAKRLRDLCR